MLDGMPGVVPRSVRYLFNTIDRLKAEALANVCD